MSATTGATGIGASVRRKEDLRFITGRGQYTDDVNRQGQSYAFFVRSPHAHANIRKVDSKAAAKMPGVLAILTGDDIAADKVGGLICGWMIHSKDGSPMKAGLHPALAQGKVRYVGDHVAVVIAETLAEARDAAEKVEVDYDVLPAVVDMGAATKKGAPVIHDVAANNTVYNWHLGDKAATDAAFAKAKHVTKLDIVNNRLVPNPMETRAAVGDYEPGTESFTLYTTSQNPHVARLVISAFIGVAPENKLRVIAPDVGGGFGSKIFIYAEEVVCVWAAKKVGRPVKWTCDRTEAFLCDAHGRDHVTHAELAIDENGRITGLRVHTLANLGAYLSTFSSSVPTYLYAPLLSGQYDIPAIYAEVDGIYTNTAPVDAYRGAGRPEATFVVERLVEVAARETGIDPAKFRQKNFITKFPHQTPVIMAYDAGNYDASLQKALEMSDYKNIGKRKAESERQGKLRGIGISAYIEACGIAPSAAVGSLGAGVGLWESAEVRVNPIGTVEVLTGSHSHGQGHETTFAQLVSDRLGIPIDAVSIVHGDTDKVQMGMGTYGSRSGAVGMSAIVKALEKIEAKAKKVAGFCMEASDKDIEFKDGKFTVRGTDKSMDFGAVALQAYIAHKFNGQDLEPGLKEGAFWDPTNFTFPAGVHICEVEIDPETGVTHIERWSAVDDFGNVINPMIVEGQVHGGIAQGIGQAMCEGAIYDAKGQLVTASFMDYCMPRADDLPSYQVGMTQTPCPSNPLGIKGCGEAGAIAAPPALINAITDALGTENVAMPATPQVVWRLAQKSITRKAAQ
ncbi:MULTISPECIES: xanthine dehydrogenase family protein molybdopterin-binding subunit [unclassified Beijerinckia]|uniref:xanthine dehydrogenase family protein molybdopterin-binding subunit n=1 Tax=unclassified Beijerinckia TaxID=2638183 RepID=UPI0008962D1C|nr:MULTISPECIES: xanthine dehydrogenase family protein molybdopterin-binding subunit [unclassified Beijerinckia]MDH7799831.1 carbon-monoxide dehydrogenase large subunit [Beijerinckia sp. GAS462]SED39072.1 xanthine dehydrogenase, molybdenum binding subunit apoprotein [Beijerinckia sp. 28-YEA-48]